MCPLRSFVREILKVTDPEVISLRVVYPIHDGLPSILQVFAGYWSDRLGKTKASCYSRLWSISGRQVTPIHLNVVAAGLCAKKCSNDASWVCALPLILYVLFNLVHALLAMPIGIWSDKIGRCNVLALVYALFALTALGFALVSSFTGLIILFSF